ncbi:DUF1624 domain-containing protein [Parapedobacter sp. DT-150]|uniref:DUF1624 domain-containing protein n=1 Tax=Parapedobacter sp. DT-150 TaxID=3396162 RepID=UPI003F19F1B3
MSTDTFPKISLTSTRRIQSVDLLRGLVIVLMAIDHVRVYSAVPAGGPEAGVFFTRWITHFCAPAFAFFAGTSAFLYGVKIGGKSKLASYLVIRGLMLVVLEVTLIRFLWAFHINYAEFFLAGIIWMLGWCMVLLAALIWFSPRVVGVVGLMIILIQSVFSNVPYLLPTGSQSAFAKFWEFIYPSGFESYEGVAVLYSIIPWIGVMAAGYGFGTICTMSEEKMRKACLAIGLTAILLFIVIGSIVIAQQPSEGVPFIFRLLNQSKYPASPLFLAMTLGPIIALVPWAEKATGWFADAMKTFGRVPFFYYLLHILVIHLSALLVQWIKIGYTPHEWYKTAPYTYVEESFRWSLPLLYLVFAADIVVLYFLCRWYGRYKSGHPEKKWLRYI